MIFSSECENELWFSTGLDLSSLLDGDVLITAGAASVTINKTTLIPVVTIARPENIDGANVNSYEVFGVCSENGETVDLSIGSISLTPLCSGGTWSSGLQSMASLADGAVVITADHAAAGGSPRAVTATTSVQKDLTAPTVTISAASDINSINQTQYLISGTCSENGEPVELRLGSLSFSQTCSNGAYTSGFIDVSALADGEDIVLEARHAAAGGSPQAQTFSTLIKKNTTTPSISGLSVATTLSTSANLDWDLVNPGGFTVSDFEIEYRISGNPMWSQAQDGVSAVDSALVSDLTPASNYEFRVRAVYNGGELSTWSNVVEGTTKPNSSIFSPNTVMNVGGATQSAVVAHYDDTTVTLPDQSTVLIDSGTPYPITASAFDTISADKPIYVAGVNGGANVVWSPVEWAGRNFSFNAYRNNPQRLFIYAVEASVVEVRQGNTVLASTSLAADGNGTLTWSQLGSYQVVSTGTILAYHESNGDRDPKPLLPNFSEIIGIPSTRMLLTTIRDSTNYQYLHSNSNANNGSLDREDAPQLNPQGPSSQYNSESLLIQADQPISGASYADGNGSCAAPFLPTNLMRLNYIINVNADWVAFASKQAGTIRVYNNSGVEVFPSLVLTRSGANPNAPFKARRGTTNGGWSFRSDVPVAGWYQPRTNTNARSQDETILFGTND